MPHLNIEVSRRVLERELLSLPLRLSPDGTPADILAPPFALPGSPVTPIGVVRYQIIVRTVALHSVTGTSQAVIAMTFDQTSIELLSQGKSAGLLSGKLNASAVLVAKQSNPSGVASVANFGADLSQSIVTFALDPPSQARLAAAIGSLEAALIEDLLRSEITTQIQSLGFQKFGLKVALTPAVPSEDLLTAETLPYAVWVDAETLALAVTYALEPVPPPFQPVPFLPAGPSAFGIRLSNDGFQRAIRNPAVRKLARDMLTAGRIDDFVRVAFANRNGTGDPTDADHAEGRRLLDLYLATPAGQAEIAGETPSPVGNGELRKRIKNVPDPFSDFDVVVPELDLWLGEGKVEGRALARGSVNGFGFSADIRFRATPVMIKGAVPSIELHDLEIDRPDIDISLPVWLRFASAVLVGVIEGPLAGALVGFLLSAVVSALVEAFIPSHLGSRVSAPDGKPVAGLPSTVTLLELAVTPDFLSMTGTWSVVLDDPRPFYPQATLVDTIDRAHVGRVSHSEASFVCLGALGILMTAEPGTGTTFAYSRQGWRSTVTVSLQTDSIPLPLTRFPWKIAVGYFLPQHGAALFDPPMIVVPGPLATTATVWLPEPPLEGQTQRRSFNIDVRKVAEDTFAFDLPPDSGCAMLGISAHIVDATGTPWDVSLQVMVPNQTVSFGPDFQDFTTHCGKQRRDFKVGKEPSLLDQLWNPPQVLVDQVQEAIRTEEPGVSREIERVFLTHGVQGLQLLLAPSLAQKIFRK